MFIFCIYITTWDATMKPRPAQQQDITGAAPSSWHNAAILKMKWSHRGCWCYEGQQGHCQPTFLKDVQVIAMALTSLGLSLS